MEQPTPLERPAAPQFNQPSLHERVPSIDILRGIGVLGALFVSIWVFGGFSEQQQNGLLLSSKGWNYRLYGLVQLLFNGKMLSLVALALGASMVIFLSKEHMVGSQSQLDVFVKRHIWLIVFGVLNAFLLLWPMDILFHLGVMGILLLVFFRTSTKGLLIAALLMTAVYCGKYYWDFADNKSSYTKYLAATALEKKYEKDSIAKTKKGLAVKKDTLTRHQKQEKEEWEGLVAANKVDQKKDDGNIKKMHSGSYGKIWNGVIPASKSREADWFYKKGVWDIAAIIFLGMLLYKIGFFSNRFSRSQYFLFALTGIGIGLLLGWYRLNAQQIALQDFEKFVKNRAVPHMLFYPVEKAVMAIGFASLVMALLSARFFRNVFYAFEAVGKMPLTNYLLQSVICTLFFYGYGMGYFARLTQVQLYFFVLELILVQSVFSVLWLRRFNYGPVEWLLRRLSVGKWLPKNMRKPSAPETPITVLS